MPDQLLSVQYENLKAIAIKIKDKCGISRSTDFSFPGDANTPNSFVGALKGIETEVTITPKITPQQKTLTPSETSFSISSGFHDGTGTVKIQFDTANNSATPSASQQTISPAIGKFFGSFVVGGLGNGVQIATGETIVQDGSQSITISGLPFNPSGIMGFLSDASGYNVDRAAFFQTATAPSSSNFVTHNMWRSNYKIRTGSYQDNMFSHSQGSATILCGTYPFYGRYRYIVWGS